MNQRALLMMLVALTMLLAAPKAPMAARAPAPSFDADDGDWQDDVKELMLQIGGFCDIDECDTLEDE